MGKLVQNLVKHNGEKCRDGILGHKFNKRLDSFAACYSQSLLLADLKKTMLFSGFNKSLQKSPKQENSSLFMNSIL
jgi:hypothetical protein